MKTEIVENMELRAHPCAKTNGEQTANNRPKMSA